MQFLICHLVSKKTSFYRKCMHNYSKIFQQMYFTKNETIQCANFHSCIPVRIHETMVLKLVILGA